VARQVTAQETAQVTAQVTAQETAQVMAQVSDSCRCGAVNACIQCGLRNARILRTNAHWAHCFRA